MRFFGAAALLAATAAATSFPPPPPPPPFPPHPHPHSPPHPQPSKRCTNSASDRSCWGDYNLSTNYYDETPDTGVTREYWFNLVNTTASIDGGPERVVLSVNGSVPGPTIIANWGDTVVIHVTNSLQDNGTSIHWHGIRQFNNSQHDGVASVTQCPNAPETTYTYRWRASQYGSSWYHSHFYVQAWDGVFGGIVINGPATANYDEDLGTIFLNDWSYQTADVELLLAENATLGGPPKLDTALMNGTNVYEGGGGHYFNTTFQSNKRYRMRIINGAADTHFKFTIDNHTLEVIATDLVPIKPYTTEFVSIGMGQRYDVIVTANSTSGLYWIRGILQSTCSTNYKTQVQGIIGYDNITISTPSSTQWNSSTADDCNDENMSNLVPYLSIDAGSSASLTEEFNAAINLTGTYVLWQMGNESFVNLWDYPTLLQLSEGNDTWTGEQNVYEMPDPDVWVYFVIETTAAVPHPMHLHGHDFWVLAQGTGTYNSSTTSLTLTNAPRRDTAMLVGQGYTVIAFKTDNPGAWLIHCHVAWHTSGGLAVQLLERESEIMANVNVDVLNSTCNAWDTYVAEDMVIQTDSGI